MVLSRGAFEALERQFPVAARTVLFNLQRHAEHLVEREFPAQRGSKVASDSLCPPSGNLLDCIETT